MTSTDRSAAWTGPLRPVPAATQPAAPGVAAPAGSPPAPAAAAPPAGPPGPRSRRRRWLRRLVVAGLLGGAVLVAALAGVVYAVTRVPLPDQVDLAQVSVIYNVQHEEIGRVGAENRTDVPLGQVPVPVRNAVLAAEDRGYYSNPGVSPKAILRALWVNVRGGEVAQGGSTITQQYVKNVHLTQDRTLRRKLQEIPMAIKLARSYSKDQVLEWYLNTIYFGRGAYGIEAAAQTYFGVPASQLTVAQGAVLAASIRSPGGYDPARNPQAAQDRFRYVLRGMAGEGWLPAEQVDALPYPAVAGATPRRNALAGTAGYLIKAVEDELARRGFSEDLLTRGGLRVTTTIDGTTQKAAEEAVAQNLPPGKVPADLQAAVVSVEPGTGAIRAMYGGRDYLERPVNNATQGVAQAGSTFKPYVLAAALSSGISLRSTFDGSSPREFPGARGKDAIDNFGGSSYGRLDLVDATAKSVNTVYVDLGLTTGLAKVEAAARAAGITTDMKGESSSPSYSLGTSSLHPVDQAAAFATFAAGGVYAAPHILDKVVQPTHDRTVLEVTPETRQAFPRDVAADATYAMQAVVARGTAARSRLAGGRVAAGKTGSTSNNYAAWMCGYTPQLATAVALFFDPIKPLVRINGVREVTGGTIPARIWKATMDGALAGLPKQDFPRPAYVGRTRNGGGAPASRRPTASATPSPVPTPSAAAPSGPPTPSPSRRPGGGTPPPTTGASGGPAPGPPTRGSG